jgi:hypothetical protein
MAGNLRLKILLNYQAKTFTWVTLLCIQENPFNSVDQSSFAAICLNTD